MDVVLITRFYPPDTGGGGIAAYASYLAKGLLQAGHQVRVISQMTPQSQPERQVDGVDVFRIQAPAVPYRYHRVPLLGRYIRFSNDLLYAWAVRRELMRLSAQRVPDMVEYADIDAESLFHPAEVAPAVVKLHTPHFVLRRFYSGKESPYDVASVSRLEKWAILGAAGLSSPSYYLAQAVAEEYGLQSELITYVPNPIDTKFFSPGEQVEEQDPMVLYVGRLEPRKGAVVFGHAIPFIARRCPEARFVFLGADRLSTNGGSQKAELQAYMQAQGVTDRVSFRGHAPPDVFREYYRRASVFVMSSLFENCPYTLLEGMATGNACVVSRAYGMQEMIVNGESGLFFEPGNAEDLASKTISLLQHADMRQALALGARTSVLERYSLAVGAEQTLAFYRTVLSGA